MGCLSLQTCDNGVFQNEPKHVTVLNVKVTWAGPVQPTFNATSETSRNSSGISSAAAQVSQASEIKSRAPGLASSRTLFTTPFVQSAFGLSNKHISQPKQTQQLTKGFHKAQHQHDLALPQHTSAAAKRNFRSMPLPVYIPQVSLNI